MDIEFTNVVHSDGIHRWEVTTDCVYFQIRLDGHYCDLVTLTLDTGELCVDEFEDIDAAMAYVATCAVMLS